jgi:putative chitinase
MGRELGLDLTNHPELAEDRDTAARIAIHYWKTRVVSNGHQCDVKEATRDINGGYSHLVERRAAATAWEQKLGRSGPGIAERQKHYDDERPRGNSVSRHRDGHINTHGLDVRHLQLELTRLGYRDAHGHVLKPDGDFGGRTREAVQAFQRAHGIDPVGLAGPQTRAALREAGRVPSPVDPAHPEHALHRQSMSAVHRLDVSLGRGRDGNSAHLEACVTRLANENGLTRIDHVVIGGGNVFVVQGGLDDPAHRVAHMPVQMAMATTVAESFRQLAEHAVQRRSPDPGAGQVQHGQTHFEHHEGLRRVVAP